MTVSSVYFDTSPFIYLVEGHLQFAPAVASFVQECVAGNTLFGTSVLTVMEFGVKPLQLGRTDLLEKFDEFIRELNFIVQPITGEIAFNAAQLRASYSFLKSLDALHLAAAQKMNCEVFLTNDRQLTQVRSINVRLLSDMVWKH